MSLNWNLNENVNYHDVASNSQIIEKTGQQNACKLLVMRLTLTEFN